MEVEGFVIFLSLMCTSRESKNTNFINYFRCVAHIVLDKVLDKKKHPFFDGCYLYGENTFY